jgi:Fungal chitosanase of glycosyl hydrolase group 75
MLDREEAALSGTHEEKMSELTKIDSVAGVNLYSTPGEPPAFIYRAGMAINADGSPNCYGPNNSGLDWTANGGTVGGEWWGGPVDSSGMPVIQKIYDPSPGMYVSGTALINPAFPEASPYRYVDSESIPFIVLPGKHNNKAKLGDAALVYNEKTGDNCYAVYGDVGPASKIGEGSIRLAEALKINAEPKSGGIASKSIVYLVFPGSVGAWKPPSVWFDVANTLFKSWGGLDRLRQLIPQL